MTLDELQEMWSIDGQIDRTDLGNTSQNVPMLHNKYWRIYSDERLKLEKLKTNFNVLKKLKTEYYKGILDSGELKRYGWEQPQLKILRQDIPVYLDADSDIINKTLLLEYQKAIVNFLEAIISQIQWRGNLIGNMINYEKFRSGG